MSDDRELFSHLRAMLQTDGGRSRFCAALLTGGQAMLADPEAVRIAIRRVMPYRAYLSTRHWTDKATAAKERAGNRCQLCNCRDNLAAHHRTYERRGNEADADLTVLCIDCHGRFHTKPEPDEYGNPAACEPEDLRWAGMTEAEQMAELQRTIDRKRAEMQQPTARPLSMALRNVT